MTPIQNIERTIICDHHTNGHNQLWNSGYTDAKGRELEELITRIPYTGNILSPTYKNMVGTTHVDVTLTGDSVDIIGWRYLGVPSLSYHQYILFEIKNNQNRTRSFLQANRLLIRIRTN